MKFSGVLIASDIDGTLLGSDERVSPKNIEAIKYFTENGGRFTVSTGRSLQTFSDLAGRIPMNAPAIHANGALLYDHAQKRVISERFMPEIIKRVVPDVSQRYPDVCTEIYPVDRKTYAYRINQVSLDHFARVKIDYIKIDSIFDIEQNWTKIFMTGVRELIEEVKGYLLETYPQFRYVYSGPEYLELIPVEIDKGRGVFTLAEMLGIKRENIYTVGDYENDLELLGAAKIAFAPSNAVPAVLERADIILPSNDEDAIAAMIEHLGEIYR